MGPVNSYIIMYHIIRLLLLMHQYISRILLLNRVWSLLKEDTSEVFWDRYGGKNEENTDQINVVE